MTSHAAAARRILSIHRYSMWPLLKDGLRAVFGLMVTLGPLLFLDPVRPLALVLGGLGIVFSIFALRLLQQSLSTIELSAEGISRRGPIGAGFSWPDMTSLKLAHYAAPRRSSPGWYQLKLKGRGGVVIVDSTIDGFDDIVASAAGAAAVSGLHLDPATSDNLRDLGHRAHEEATSDGRGDEPSMPAG